MEISTETCTRDLKKLLTYCIISFVSGFFPDVSAATPILMFSLWSCRFVLLIFYAKVTVLMERMKYNRFLQVVAEHVTIIWPVLFDHLTIFFAQNTRRLPILSIVFPINSYRIRVRVKIPRDRLTMCRWIGSHFHDCIDFYGVAFSAIFSRVTRINKRLPFHSGLVQKRTNMGSLIGHNIG